MNKEYIYILKSRLPRRLALMYGKCRVYLSIEQMTVMDTLTLSSMIKYRFILRQTILSGNM